MADSGEGSSRRAQRLRRMEPQNPLLLYDQQNHRSSQATLNADRTTGTDTDIRIRGGKLCSNWKLDPTTERIVKDAGFLDVGKASGVNIDGPLLDCIMERWRGETHSFHLPVGEMTITLQDVTMILGLPADGFPVTDYYHQNIPQNIPVKEHVIDLCERLLGVRPREGTQYGLKRATNEIYFTWLHTTFCRQDEPENEVVAERRARAYIMTLFGSCLFPTTSGNVVSPHYLYLLEDLTRCNTYSWASSVLAYTYSGLCKGVRLGAKQVTICRPLLMVWCYEHIPVGVPKMLKNDLPVNTIAALRWVGKTTRKLTPKTTHPGFYKDQLKGIRTKDIIWNPWTPQRTRRMPNVCKESWELSRKHLPLIHMNIVEWQLPDRVQRQFGLQQPIPTEFMDRSAWTNLHECREWTKKTKWHEKHHQFLQSWGQRWMHPVPEPMVGATEMAYMTWYHDYTVTLVMWPTQTVERSVGESSGYYNPTGNANSLILRCARSILKGTKKLMIGASDRERELLQSQLCNIEGIFEASGEGEQFVGLLQEPVSDSEETVNETGQVHPHENRFDLNALYGPSTSDSTMMGTQPPQATQPSPTVLP